MTKVEEKEVVEEISYTWSSIPQLMKSLGIDFYVNENLKVNKLGETRKEITITIPDNVSVNSYGEEMTCELKDGWRIIKLKINGELSL